MTSDLSCEHHHDAIIVGARCAGAATAMLLARGGLRVLAVDRSAYGSDTLSTHALMRGAVLQLARWGVLPALRASDTPMVRSTTFHYGGDALEIAIKPRAAVDALYAPRRTLLDALLVDAARAAGADVRHGVRVRELSVARSGRVTGVVVEDAARGVRELRGDLVIGADGVKSLVARGAGARALRQAAHASTVAYAYYARLPVTGYLWYYMPGASAAAIPTGGGLTCVCLMLPGGRHGRQPLGPDGSGFERALVGAAPQLAAALAGARRVGPIRTFGGRPGYLRQAFGPGFALVGDAGSFKDPSTAHGITDALRDAELLARAVLAGGAERDLAGYQSARDAFALPFLEISDAVAAFEWDLPEVRALHRAFSDHMTRETEMLASLDAAAPEAA